MGFPEMHHSLFQLQASKIYDQSAWCQDPIDFTTKFNDPKLYFDLEGMTFIIKFMQLHPHNISQPEGFIYAEL